MSGSNNSLQNIVESVYKQVESNVNTKDNKYISDDDLLSLHSVLGSVLLRAIELIDKQTLIVYNTANNRRSLIEIKGTGDRYYRLFHCVNFCPCLAFKHQVLEKKLQVTCKHVVAARLSLILDKIVHSEVTNEQYAVLLKSIFALEDEKLVVIMDIEGTCEYYFTALMDSGKMLCSLLKAIQFQETAVLTAMSEGLKLTVEEGKCVQATAYVPAENFTEYHVRSDVEVSFKVSIAVLTECLNIFGSGEESSLKMYYRCEGSPLLLILQPLSFATVMTDCEISTQTADSVLQLRDEEAAEVATVVLRAPAFLGLLADLERSCEIMELRLSPDHPHMSIVTYGMQDRSCIDVPKSSDMMLSFRCENAVTLKYQLQHIRHIMKALAISSKVLLKCTPNGLLQLQLKIEKEDQREMFSEFTIVPLLDDF